MLSRNRLKFYSSLQRKKVREEEGLFVVEGDKIVREFLGSGMEVISLLCKPEFLNMIEKNALAGITEVIPVSFEELRRMSSLTTPHNAMAVVRIPERKPFIPGDGKGLCAALDFIQDPGNLGTIIRAAAWFGIENIACSENCVDVYNPKVIQATMGAILTVNVFYTDLSAFLGQAKESGVEIYGTLLDGKDLYREELKADGIILLGNESRGISEDLQRLVTQRITIPKFSVKNEGIESLNAGMAASVVFSEFARRRITFK